MLFRSKDLEARLPEIARAHPKHLHVRIGYDETLAHRIMAGCDAILVPSRFEPCGLTQLYALAYGTLPLVHRVGGLADTVCDATPANLADGLATGFVFDQPDVPSLKAALDRLFLLWQSPGTWSGMRQNAMRQDFGWPASARQYHALYRELRPGA